MLGTKKNSAGLGYESILSKYESSDVPSKEGTDDVIKPSAEPQPSGEPTGEPSAEPQPSGEPTGEPINKPAAEPTGEPQPSGEPTGEPSGSSLKPKAEPTPSPEITEQMIFERLSEKLGKDVKSYEDLQSKPVEIREDVKALNEWVEKTGRPISDYFKFTRDFSQVSDLDIAREVLQLEYNLTPEEVELELEQYIVSEDDLDNEAALKKLNLKKYATKGRKLLEDMKLDLGTPDTNNLTPEIKKKIELFDQLVQMRDTQQAEQGKYFEGLKSAVKNRNVLELQLSDDLSINFNISDDEKNSIPTFINDMPHWRDEEGNWNHDEVVKDAIKIKNFPKLIRLAYEQGIDAGKEAVIKGDVKNVTLDANGSPQPNQGSNRPVYENFDKSSVLGKTSLKFTKK